MIDPIEDAISKIIEGVYDPGIFRAIFMAGGPGSGKSYVARKTTSGLGLKIVASDAIFEYLLKQAGHDLNLVGVAPDEFADKMRIRKIAQELNQKQKARYVEGRLGMVIDGTGHSYEGIKQMKADLEGIGYDTFMIFVNTPLAIAQERNAHPKGKIRQRSLPPAVVEEKWRAVQDNLGRFQNLFGENFKIIDNTDAEEEIFDKTWVDVMKFVKSPITNPIAQAWMAPSTESVDEGNREDRQKRQSTSGLPANGDCYAVAGRHMLGPNDGALLVHGTVAGQGDLEGIRFGHAWIEKDGMVIDRSNGRNLEVPIELYYTIGRIGDHHRGGAPLFKYTHDEAGKKMLESGHFGPWDYNPEY